MRCVDCIDGEISPAECCDLRVAEEADYVRGLCEALQAMIVAAEDVLAQLEGPVMVSAVEEPPQHLHATIAALMMADYERRRCGGVVEGLVDQFGTPELRTLLRDLR